MTAFIPTRACSKCGKQISWTTVVCPYCGDHKSFNNTNYSGSISFSASAAIAIEKLSLIQERRSHQYQYSDSEDINFVIKVIKNLDKSILEEKKEDFIIYEKKISEYKNLIQKNAEENEFQKFFIENPVFLNRLFDKCESKESFGGERYPDFVLTLKNLNYVLVEVEKPSKKLFTQTTKQPSAELTQARHQIETFLKWARDDREFLRNRGYDKINADNTNGLLIIGKKGDLSDEEIKALKNINFSLRGYYKIKTFDEIYEENLTTLNNLKKKSGN